jgi:hypothetical protein
MEQNHQIVDHENTNLIVSNPMDASPAHFRAGLDRRKENRKTMMEWIRSSLVEGRDYGSIIIRGQKSKPSLLKPGAEKITGMLGLIPRFPNLEQYEQAVLNGNQVETIILKCELRTQDGDVIGEGVGARQVEKQDQGDLNKALKMASKSAMIDATLRCAGISEIFTQDIEGMNQTMSSIIEPVEVYKANDSDSATEKQVAAVRNLIDNPKVYLDEKRKLHEVLEDGLIRTKAKEILDYFYGQSELLEGNWVRKGYGILGKR